MRRLVLLACVIALAAPSIAHAALKRPFAEATTACPGGAVGTATLSKPIKRDHVNPLVRIESSGDPYVGGSADFTPGPEDRGVWETYWTENPVRFWREVASVVQGQRLGVGTECADRDWPYTVSARWYARPVVPAAFNGANRSVVGFRARRPGRYVVDVTPGAQPLRVAMEDHHTGEYSTWPAEVQRSATFSAPGRLHLGYLLDGDHNLTVGFGDGCDCHAVPTGAWSIVVRRVGRGGR
jgi:hypothetical protein